jgi:DNA polymerase
MATRPPRAPRTRRAAESAAEASADRSIAQLRREARDCRACPLWKPATQTVFGEGPDDARIVVIGESPGDQEDLAGHPFVGPAGHLLDRALAEAGIDRGRLYVTNAVKHFKFEQRGKLRLHKRANAAEQAACRIWLDAELLHLRPRRIVCLGAMAARAVFGRAFRLMRQRGTWIDLGDGTRGLATVHPSYLLRLRGDDERDRGFADFVCDLAKLVT